MDTVSRAKIAAASRWNGKKKKNTSVIYVDDDLARRLKCSAKSENKAIGDYLKETIEAYDKAVDMLDAIDTDNAELKDAIEELKKYKPRVHRWKNIK